MFRFKWSCVALLLVAVAWPGAALTVTILDPKDGVSSTTRGAANILGRAEGATTAVVGGVEVPVYATTSLFVRDQVPLEPGVNTIVVEVRDGRGARAQTSVTITRTEAPPTPAVWQGPEAIDRESLEPSEDVILMRGDVLRVGFRGLPGQRAAFRLPEGRWVDMVEEADPASTEPTGRYRGHLVVTADAETTLGALQVRLTPTTGTEALAEAKGRVGTWAADTVRLARVVSETGDVLHGLHEVRLGGPFLAELPRGTIVQVTGLSGRYYRVRLAPMVEGWVLARELALLPAGTPPPHMFFTSLSVAGDDTGDTVTIPYSAPVPFAVESGTGPGGRAVLDIDLFGAHHAATWISHLSSAKVVREATVRQAGPDHVRVRVELADRQLWGYRCEVTTGALHVRVRAPRPAEPRRRGRPDLPLRGLVIALEPGHGGPRNVGARGVSGSEEKEINRLTVEALKTKLEARGSTVVVVRRGDEDIGLGERARRVVEADADLFVSIHANSAGTDRGYLRAGGLSNFYKHAFSRPLADAIHRRTLAATGLRDAGLVGNFNYTPIRTVTWAPSMLVEQAFMSNPEDEAKLLDPAFRDRMAEGIAQGIADFVREAGRGDRLRD
ncbi:MAG: N-acetylmuramoyl-L-alanine amidase [Candidatus Sumerlaeaceae bacterium]|nr:N-acetylmuramoyl-L-alanine amidase [Candidatus Sumerlaeaceae bacterium]